MNRKEADLVIDVILTVNRENGSAKKSDRDRLQSKESSELLEEFRALFPTATDLQRRLKKTQNNSQMEMLIRAYHPKSEPTKSVSF